MKELYENTFASAALEIAVQGWSSSKVPDNLKDWCAREICQKLPDSVIKELFGCLVTNPESLPFVSISFKTKSGNSISQSQLNHFNHQHHSNGHKNENNQKNSHNNTQLHDNQLRILTSEEEDEDGSPVNSHSTLLQTLANHRNKNGASSTTSADSLLSSLPDRLRTMLTSATKQHKLSNQTSSSPPPVPNTNPDKLGNSPVNPLLIGLKLTGLTSSDGNIQSVVTAGHTIKNGIKNGINNLNQPTQKTQQPPTPETHPFECEECGKLFKNNAGFKMHQRSHAQKALKQQQSPHNPSSAIDKLLNGITNSLTAAKNGTEAGLKNGVDENSKIKNLPSLLSSISNSLNSPSGSERIMSSPNIKTEANGLNNGDISPNSLLNAGGPADIPAETSITAVTGEDGEKRHMCNICGYTSKRFADLRDHQRIHSDERPFVCTICNSKFKQRQTLRNHRRNVHKVNSLVDPKGPLDTSMLSTTSSSTGSPPKKKRLSESGSNMSTISQAQLAALTSALTNGAGSSISSNSTINEHCDSKSLPSSDSIPDSENISNNLTIPKPKSDEDLTNATLSSLLSDQFNVNNLLSGVDMDNPSNMLSSNSNFQDSKAAVL